MRKPTHLERSVAASIRVGTSRKEVVRITRSLLDPSALTHEKRAARHDLYRGVLAALDEIETFVAEWRL